MTDNCLTASLYKEDAIFTSGLSTRFLTRRRPIPPAAPTAVRLGVDLCDHAISLLAAEVNRAALRLRHRKKFPAAAKRMPRTLP